MKKWVCRVCGYTHHHQDAPERCPKCGAPRSQFYKDEEDTNWKIPIVIFVFILTAGIATICFFACSSSTNVDNSVVKSMDIYKYQGKWYEIARFDHKFERGMDYCTATYTLQNNGTINVVNQGKKKGEWKTSTGVAKLTDIPGILRVSFWRPFYSDYRILMLAPDYSYVLVGGDDDDYLWILSRTPTLRKDITDSLIDEAQRRGYKTEKLIWVKQK